MSADWGAFDGAPTHDKPPLPPAAELVERVRQGTAVKELARQYQRAPQTIRGYVRRRGLALPRADDRDAPSPVQRTSRQHVQYPGWMDDAVCATHARPELWWPHPNASGLEAKRICKRQCPVTDACLTWALEHGERDGIYGGLDPAERRALGRAGGAA